VAGNLDVTWIRGAPDSADPSLAANDDELADDYLSNNNFSFSGSTPVVILKDGTQASGAYALPAPQSGAPSSKSRPAEKAKRKTPRKIRRTAGRTRQ
jgi:hypothetical protein